ncbi:MAG TPA: CHAD domain-containing protein [Caulobacteraceae bacterium]|nr:CHAD domain-containing protein [Caulobacteraceae bacterium]
MPESRPTETELKFLVGPKAADELRAHPALKAPERTQHLRSIYYDTPGWRLHRERVALRLRDTGRGMVQTLKQYGGDGAFSRGEWERKVRGDRIDLDALKDTPAAAALCDDDGELEPVFVTTVERNVRRCAEDGALIEVGYDVGELEAGDRRTPIQELELELKHGEPAALFALARRLAADVDIRLSFESKSERGYRLADDAELEPRTSQIIPLDPKMSAAAAFKALAISCLGQAAANAEILGDHARPEAVHQMRIGLRRLRAVMKAFEPMLPGTDGEAVDDELKWLAGELDHARNLDVLISSSYVRAVQSLDATGFAALGRRLLEAQTKAYRRAGSVARSRRCARLWLEAAAWIEAGDWTSSDDPIATRAREKPIQAFAAEALDHLRKVVRKRGRLWDRLDARGRHKLRIRAKRMRYAAELFSPLFRRDAGGRKAFLGPLKQMQGCLGDLNDVDSARDKALSESMADEPELAFALGRVVGWREFDEPALKGAAAKAVKLFCKAEPFWR